ncbi:hypothetical protein KCV07_g287, partial [Aureobasidium melanogenum]
MYAHPSQLAVTARLNRQLSSRRTHLSKPVVINLQELNRVLVIFDKPNTSNRLVIPCQSKHVFWQFAGNLNRILESAQNLCGTCIRCSLTQRPRTRSLEHQGHLFRICFLRHRGTLLQDNIMSQALLRLRLFRWILTTESAGGSPKMTPRYDSCSLETIC